MTPAQQAALKADIIAKSASGQPLEAMFAASDWDSISNFYNAAAAPDYWTWGVSISRAQLYHTVSPTLSTWNWAAYKTQSQGEQGAWVQMFMGDIANFSLQNLRSGVKEIFSGSAPQNAQRDHCFAIARRKATVVEKLFAVAVPGSPFASGALADTGNNSGATGAPTNPAISDPLMLSGRDVLDAVHS